MKYLSMSLVILVAVYLSSEQQRIISAEESTTPTVPTSIAVSTTAGTDTPFSPISSDFLTPTPTYTPTNATDTATPADDEINEANEEVDYIPDDDQIITQQNERSAKAVAFKTIKGRCLYVGVKASGSFGNGNGLPAIQYNKQCNGTFTSKHEFISAPVYGNWKFEALGINLDGAVYADDNAAYAGDSGYSNLVDTESIKDASNLLYRGTRWQNRLVTHGRKYGMYSIENDIRFNDNSKIIEITTYFTPSIYINNLYIGRSSDMDLFLASGDDWAGYNGLGYSTLDAKFLVVVESIHSRAVSGYYTGDETNAGAGLALQITGSSANPTNYYLKNNPGFGDYTIGITKYFANLVPGRPYVFKYSYVFGESAYQVVSNAVRTGAGGGVPGRVPGCHSCVISDDGQIAPTRTGTIGTNTPTRTPRMTLTKTPTPIPYLLKKGVVGASFVLGLLHNKTLVTWGMNREYQTNIPPCCGTDIDDIAVGTNFALALKNGRVYGWGSNTIGQIDIPLSAQSSIKAIAAGGGHGLALRKSGHVVAWGDNTSKQSSVPRIVRNIKQVAGGAFHSLALTQSGKVLAWGENGSGQRNVPRRLKSVIQIAGGMDHSLALRANGTVSGWGGNAYGQSKTPRGTSEIKQISAGNQFSLAVRKDGSVIGWGRNEHKVFTVPDEYTDIYYVAAGYANTILGLRNGRIVVLGDQSNGVAVSRTPTP